MDEAELKQENERLRARVGDLEQYQLDLLGAFGNVEASRQRLEAQVMELKRMVRG